MNIPQDRLGRMIADHEATRPSLPDFGADELTDFALRKEHDLLQQITGARPHQSKRGDEGADGIDWRTIAGAAVKRMTDENPSLHVELVSTPNGMYATIGPKR